MNETHFALISIAIFLLFPLITVGQTDPSFCPQAKAVEGVILTICTHEKGMAPIPQPRLYLRVHADGRAEYEVSSGNGLALKRSHIAPEEVVEVIRLMRTPELAAAKPEYPRYKMFTDSSRITTITLDDNGVRKKIVLNNFTDDDPDNERYYPAPLIRLMQLSAEARDRAMGIVRPIPTISFCELYKNSRQYIGKKISMYSNFEYRYSVMATGKIVNQREILNDPECSSPADEDASYRIFVSVGYQGTQAEIDQLKKKTLTIRDWKTGYRARVLVTGVLTTASEQDLRFDIASIGNIEPYVIPYRGPLRNGWTYSDTFEKREGQEFELSSRLIMPRHHAGRIDWRNAEAFPQLLTAGRKHIVFRISSMTTQFMGEGRWNSTYHCDILEVKLPYQ